MEVIKFDNRDEREAIELVSLGDESYLKGKNQIWKWQYSEYPLSRKFGIGIAVKNDSGKLVAFNGIMPVKLWLNGTELDAYWNVDTVVHADAREQGINSKMIAEIKSGASVILVLRIGDLMSEMLLRRGYVACKQVGQFFLVNKPENIRDAAKFIIQRLRRLALSRKSAALSRDLEVVIIEAKDAPKALDDLWHSSKHTYKRAVVRDYEYIYWKYGKHPLVKYKIITVNKNNKLAAVGVFRGTKVISRLLDYVGPADDKALKTVVLNTFLESSKNSRLLECTTSDNLFKELLANQGFTKYKKQPRFYVYSENVDKESLINGWFVTGGDSDNDLAEFRDFE